MTLEEWKKEMASRFTRMALDLDDQVDAMESGRFEIFEVTPGGARIDLTPETIAENKAKAAELREIIEQIEKGEY